MIIKKAFYWLFLMMINIPILFGVLLSTFFVNLFNMPFEIWEGIDEFFSNQ